MVPVLLSEVTLESVGINVKSGKKKLSHIYRGLNKKLQTNNKTIYRNCLIYRGLYKKFIGIYIKNCKKFDPESGRVPRVAGP